MPEADLILEDGQGIIGANAYIDVAFYKEYHGARGNAAALAFTDDQIAEAIIRATDETRRYALSWIGVQATADQGLDWPRLNAVLPGGVYQIADDAVPDQLKVAVAELAFRATTGPLSPDLAAGGRIKSRKVGPLETVYQDDAPMGTSRPSVSALLTPLLGGGSGWAQGTLVRA